MKRMLIGLVLAAVAVAAGAQEPGLALDEALSLARAHQPALAAAGLDAEAAGERAEQAGAWPNPEAFFKLEGAPRDGDTWRGANRIVGLSQTVPWTGRTGAERRVAAAAAERQVQSRELTARQVDSAVRTAFAEALHAREALVLAADGVAVARRLHDLVAERVDAGDAAMVDLRRARMELGAARADLVAARAADSNTLVRLATAAGVDPNEVSAVRGALVVDSSVPQLAELLDDLDSAPRLRIAGAAVDERVAVVTRASRLRLPDIALEAGLRSAPDGDSFDAGLSFAVPLFDRGGARVRAARATAAAAEWRALGVRRELVAAVHEAHAALAVAVESAVLYDEVVVPEATAALLAAEAAYTAGDADLTGILQITRDWLAARMVRLDLLLAAARARASLSALL